jgi:glycosyltransferase involved in cell wall biosynthesis
MARILVISGDILPHPGCPTTGAGLRAWSLAKGLETRKHDVLLAMPRSVLEKKPDLSSELHPFLYVNEELTPFIQGHRPDVVILQHWWLSRFLDQSLDLPLVIDLHGPLLLETLFQDNPAVEKLRQEKILAFHKADFLTCAGEKQRYYFEAWLLMAGFDVRQEVIRSIPVSLSPELPRHEQQGEPAFVYGGVFLPWQDPVLGLTTLVECLERKGRGVLKFFGGKHPVVAVPTGKFDELRQRLQRSQRVQIQPMIARDQLIQEYCHAHVAIDLMQRNAERELAFTTRTVEYLWCGLPVIYNNYAELADYIREYDAGWTLDPQDETALRNVLEEILDAPETLVERSQNAQRLVRERLNWETTIEPLDAFCRQPVKRQKQTPVTAFTRPSFSSQLNYFAKKLSFHLQHEGLPTTAKRVWKKGRQMFRL